MLIYRQEKSCRVLIFHIRVNDVFPWKNQLSEEVDDEEFCKSFFIQPDLFLRIRPGHELVVKKKLNTAGIPYFEKAGSCISVSNSSRVDTIIELDTEAVIQDLNSQRTGEFIQSAIDNLQSPVSAWDCCAASGGKSIMLYDINPGIQLAVSDIRESILLNLRKRFARAGINSYKSFITDLSNENAGLVKENYNLVIADVPCSGSGTWAVRRNNYIFLLKQKLRNTIRCKRKLRIILSAVCNRVVTSFILPAQFLKWRTRK